MQNRPECDLTLTDDETKILLKYFPQGVVAFDLEMTGLSPVFDKIIEIAAAKLLPNGEVTFYHQMINPLVSIPDYTIEFHQITNDMVRDCPTLKKPLLEFNEFYGSLPIIAHNAQFDVGYLVKGHHEFNYPFSLSDVFDSCIFSRALYKKEKSSESKPLSFKLGDLAKFFDIEFNHHQALDDAMVSLKVFAQCLVKFNFLENDRSLKDISFLYKINSFKKAAEYELPKKLLPLREKLIKREKVFIKYKGGTHGSDYRAVEPVSLLPMPQGLILYAKCLETNMNKHFMVNKIKDLKLELDK